MVLALVLGAGVAAAAGHERGVLPTAHELLALVRPQVMVEVDGRTLPVPHPPASDGRLLPAVAVTTVGSHAFLHTDAAGDPVGYDPCRPVRWVVRPDGVPPGGDQVVAEALATVSAATGLQLEPAGTTDEAPVRDRAILQPERYGSDWAPLLIAWADQDEVPELAGQVAGVGGSAVVPGADGTGSWLAAGRLVLDRDDLGALLADGQTDQVRAVVVHELGHVVGLDHVDDPAELMQPTMAVTTLGPGDLAGLARLGQVTCQ